MIRLASTSLLAATLWSVAGIAVGADHSHEFSAGRSMQIGTLNSMETEFNHTGLQGVDEFVWVLGIDSNWANFPAMLASPSAFAEVDPQGGVVERLTLVFATDGTVHNVTIDVTKGGAETLLIDYDGVTHTFLAQDIGSDENLVAGVARLELNGVKPGWHAFTLRLADDGLGNGHSYIDAVKVAAAD